MSKNADFFETSLSQVNEVGLSMYVVYVVTKNDIDLFHWELNCFDLFWFIDPIIQSCEIYYTNLVENIHWTHLCWNSFMNGLIWINDWWVLNMMFIMMWCIFSLLDLWEWHEVVELLGDVVGVLYMLCAYMLLVNFLTHYWCWIVGESMYSYSRWKCGECMHCWLSHMFTHTCWVGCLHPYCRWPDTCIHIAVDNDVMLASGVTTSEVNWYHTCPESV